MAGKSSKGVVSREGNGLRSSCRQTSKKRQEYQNVDESFPKRERLLRRSDFIRVQKQGSKIATRSMLILYHPGQAGKTRLGIAVSKKVGKSVLRNRLKRLIREVFRKNKSLFRSSTDYVIIPKRTNRRLSYRAILGEMNERKMKRR